MSKTATLRFEILPAATNAALITVGCLLLILAIAPASAQSPGPEILKVEPPNWWTRHSINPVRLLIRGNRLNGARVHPLSKSLKTSRVRVNDRGTYVFVDVMIAPTAKAGSYPIVVETNHGKVTAHFKIEQPLPSAGRFQGVNNDDVIYLIMPDRFANGDPSNDAPSDAPASATDRKNPRAYHGGDLRGIINKLPYLKELGVTALWLTPWHDNWNGINTCSKPWCPNTYYHGYHAIDYYAVEDRFGDLASLLELVDKAHALGIKVIQDQVANHVGSRHPWVTDPPLPDWFHGTIERHEVNKFNNSALLSPHANHAEKRNTLDGWFSDDLPDMNQEQPEVQRYEIQNSLWWVGMTGIDGIRQDTIQYMPRSFIRQLADALHRQYPRLWMVGEVFERDAAQTSFFIGGHTGWDNVDTHLDSVFDFALWNTSLRVFTNKQSARALRDQLKYDALYPDPLRITTLQNNHDTERFMSLDGADLDGAMMHMAFILSVRGVPQIYYGEEIAMEGGHDPDNRRDFPGGFPADTRTAFTAQGRTTKEQRMYEWTRDWIRLRAQHTAFSRGKLVDLFYDEDAYVFARQDMSNTLIIAFNPSKKAKSVTLLAASIGLHDGDNVKLLIGEGRSANVANGEIAMQLPGRSAAAFTLLHTAK